MSRREAIIERSVTLASEEGLEGLTIGRLASELDLSKSGLFGHFGSKEELQLATVAAAQAIFAAAVIAPTLDVPEGAERLRALFDRFVAYLEDEVFSGGCFFAAAAAEFDGRPGPVRDRLRDGIRALLGEFARQAELAGAEDPHQLVFELHSIILGANAGYQLMEDPVVFERARRAIDRRLGELL